MSEFSHPVYEHPETGKVLNPITENWIQKSYANQIGVLQDAQKKTAKFFREKEAKAEEAAEKVIDKIQGGEKDKRDLLNSNKDNEDDDREQLNETERVEYNEDGGEHRVDHGSSGGKKTPDEALDSIMNDIDNSKDDIEGEEFVDVEAKESDNVPEDIDEENWKPENVDVPTFPGGVYSTKSRGERKKKQKMREINDAQNPSKRGDTEPAGKNKHYEHTENGGIRVVYEDEENKNN